MKKKVLLAILTIIMIFNSKNVLADEGIYMTMECSRGNDKNPFITIYATDNSGDARKGIAILELGEETFKYRDFHDLTSTCWLNNNKKIDDAECENNEDIYSFNNKEIFTTGTCPADIRYSQRIDENNTFDRIVVPYGQKAPVKTSKLTNYKFIAYSFVDDGETKTIIEAYSKDGRYGYLGGDLVNGSYDEITYQQVNTLINMYKTGELDFFNIDNKFKTLQISGNGNDDSDIALCEKGLEYCKTNYNFNVLLVSGDGINLGAQNKTINAAVDKYFKEDGVKEINDFFDENELYKSIMTKQDFLNTSKDLNEQMNSKGTYKFGNYDMDSLINDLYIAAPLIDGLYKLTDGLYETKNLETYLAETIMQNYLGVKDLEKLKWEDEDDYSLNLSDNQDVVYTSLLELISQKMDSLAELKKYGFNFVRMKDDLDNYGGMLYETVNNLASGQFKLSISQENKIKDIKEIFDRIADERDYTFAVVNCAGLLSENLINKINSYLDIIKIAIPILIVVLGIIDFSKAVFSGEDEMKKSQKSFIKRIAVAILFFFVPTIVNLLLQLANKVWPIIIPNTCQVEEIEE